MEPTCRFGIEYTPLKTRDPVLEIHLANCEDCQQQVVLVE